MKKTTKGKILIISFIYRIILDLIVATVMTDIFEYSFEIAHFNITKFFITNIILLLYVKELIYLIKAKTHISNNIILILIMFYFIPSLVYCTWYEVNTNYLIALVIYSIFFFFLNRKIPTFNLKIEENKKNNLLFYIIIITMIGLAFFISGYYNHFNLHFSLNDVYDLREEQINMSLPTAVRYIQPIAGSIIPFFIVFFLDRKNYIMTLISILAQLLIFSFGGLKTYLFYIVCALGSYYLLKFTKSTFSFIKTVTIIAFTGLIEYLINNSFYIVNYIIRRVMLVPAAISTFYFDFFTTNPPDYWRQSIMRWFGFESQYHENITYMIGRIYMNDSTIMANNGMLGDAFANFSWLGIIILPILLIIALKIMDGCSKNISYKVTFVLAIVYGMNFTNGTFWARMLTNGFVIACLILFLIPRKYKKIKEDDVN